MIVFKYTSSKIICLCLVATGKESFYEELARVQKIEMDKREKDPSKNDVLATATKKAEEEAKKR